MREVAQGNEEEESFYLGAVRKQRQSSAEHWVEQNDIGHTPVRFRIDTSADVTVMNSKTINTLQPVRKLEAPCGASESPGGL